MPVFNCDDLVEQGLVTKKTYTDGEFAGLSVYKYSRKVFFDNLWDQDERLLNCRVTVVDENHNIVMLPFKKVFNYLERDTCKDLPDDAPVMTVQKMNGFLANVTMYNGELLIGTTGTLDSDYARLARDVIKSSVDPRYKFIDGYTYMFEICDPSDPHIIKEDAGAYLIGIRPNEALDSDYLLLEETLDNVAYLMGCKRPSVDYMNFGTVKQLSKEVKHEGYMIRSYLMEETLCKLKSSFYLQKKALQRCGKNKANLMFDQPEKFIHTLDEEFVGLFQFILKRFTKEEYLTLTEQERSDIIFAYFENVGAF